MPKKFTVKGIKKRETAHPRSRKAVQLARAQLRRQKLDFAKERLLTRKNALILRLSWFQEILRGMDSVPTLEDINEWIKIYIDRFDEELDKLQSQMRPGRPVPVKVDEIKMAKKQELDEFATAGFEMANVLDAEAYRNFSNWDGLLSSLHVFKLMRYRRLSEDSPVEMEN